MSTVTIVGISGSLRRGSINAALLRSALERVPSNVRVEVGTIRGIPLFDEDVEREEGIPEAVTALKEQIARADGLLIATPEYNQGIPGVVKNTIDWLTRPYKDIPRIFGRRPVAVIGASPLPSGAGAALAALPLVLRLFGARTFEKNVSVPSALRAFDQNGALLDEQLAIRLREFMAEFVAFVQAT